MPDRGPLGAMFRNRILAALPISEVENLRPHLHQMSVIAGQTLHEPRNPISDVFFVEEGVISLTADSIGNGQVEVGLTGSEGLVGAPAILNAQPFAVHRAITQVTGRVYRIGTSVLRSAIEQSPVIRDLCMRSVEVLMIQSAQVAACNAKHNLPERLARWLLMVRDRIDSDNLPMTQEFLSVMLGVRRSGVSVAANTLQAGGLIRLSRGHVLILDREGLAAASCECYRIIEESRERILGNL
jgi:CRP-like cAMP-binding protein